MIKKGIYQHFKGNRYEVLDIARHSETGEEHVVYRTLYGGTSKGEGSLWVRPLSMFGEDIEHDGELKKRFEFVEES